MWNRKLTLSIIAEVQPMSTPSKVMSNRVPELWHAVWPPLAPSLVSAK